VFRVPSSEGGGKGMCAGSAQSPGDGRGQRFGVKGEDTLEGTEP